MKKASVIILIVAALGVYGYFHGRSHNWDSSWHTAYMDSCTKTGENQAYCQCTYDYIRQQYTVNEFNALNDKYVKAGSKDIPDEMKPVLHDALHNCLSLS